MAGRWDGRFQSRKSPAADAANEEIMKTILAIMVTLVAVCASNQASAQVDYNSYFNRPLPNRPGTLFLSVAHNVIGLQWALSMKGKKVGNGQCTDLVVAALQRSGARPADFSNYRRYVWGANVTGVSIQAGDVIQFERCKFKWTKGNSWGEFNMDHHTAIIAGFSGNTLQLLHQNANGGPVEIQALDLSWKTQGTWMIWRPVRY
jgi:hypothetical protein